MTAEEDSKRIFLKNSFNRRGKVFLYGEFFTILLDLYKIFIKNSLNTDSAMPTAPVDITNQIEIK